ncbi:MAG: ABC transporter ATP-binding protein [Acidimicrobiales bacterium]|nr:ABC transporter ATP-binding protein [Actinomycetota bacterium]
MSGPVLEVVGVTVRHGGLVALNDVDLSVEPATIAGLIGPNGAGKTTFIDTLSGFTRPRTGRISFDGERVEELAPHDRARRGLVRTFQSLELFDDLTVRENLLVAEATPTLRATVTDLFRRKDQRSPRAEELLDDLGLAGWADRLPTELSNGQRHLVALARAVVARPKLLLLDEPAAGLDPAETAELGEILQRLPELGTSVLLVDHDMALVMGVCHVVNVLDFGRVIATGTPAQVRSDPQVVAAYLGSEGRAS